MVHINEILKNFIPNFYKKISEKGFNSKSFLSVIGTFVLILGILFLFSSSPDMKETLNVGLNNKLIYLSYAGICVNLIGLLLFREEKLQKFLVVILYFTCILMIYIVMAICALMTDNPVTNLEIGIVGSNLLWIVGIIVNAILVWKSVETSNFRIRDKYANYFMNGISIVGIVLFLLSEIINDFTYAYAGVVFLVAMVQILATFHFPRIVRYWKKGSYQDTNISIYGDSIKMMKNKK